MTFDVASVKPNTNPPSPSTATSNIALGPGDYYSPAGGLFSVINFPLTTYISFAYKLTASQQRVLFPQLPKWVATDRFDIQARAEGNATKDQMRLMIQSLLADRFKLAIYYETRQLPVFGLVLESAERMGPQLQLHRNDAVCAGASGPTLAPGSAPSTSETVAGGFPAACGGVQPMPPSQPGRTRMGGRDVTMALIASTLPAMSNNLDRPVLDQTGLKGTFDFTLEWTPQNADASSLGAASDPGDSGPTFLEALREQLGLKLESRSGPVDVIVVDHIERPSAN